MRALKRRCTNANYKASIYYVEVFGDRLEFPELRAEAERLAREYKPDRSAVEDVWAAARRRTYNGVDSGLLMSRCVA